MSYLAVHAERLDDGNKVPADRPAESFAQRLRHAVANGEERLHGAVAQFVIGQAVAERGDAFRSASHLQLANEDAFRRGGMRTAFEL